jgi:hypothetical protein
MRTTNLRAWLVGWMSGVFALLLLAAPARADFTSPYGASKDGSRVEVGAPGN